MSGLPACRCDERSRAPEHRQWRVTRRNYRVSAFDGYHRMTSDFSDVTCLKCGAYWRTKAGYVPALPDATEADQSTARLARAGRW